MGVDCRSRPPLFLRGLILAAAFGASPAAADHASFLDPEYVIDVWETDQGLPENSATAMVQTPDGYLWFGTFNGLVRYDGARFAVFDRSNTPQLPSPGIVNLYLDRSGRLWVSTMHGMACVKEGRWTVYGDGSGWTGTYARFFAESAAGELYVTTFDGKVLRFKGDGFEDLHAPSSPVRSGFAPHVDEAGNLWVISADFIGRRVNGVWQETIPVGNLLRPGPREAQIAAATARDGSLWIASQRGLRRYRGGRLVFEVDAPWPMTGLWSLYEDSAGSVWICSFSSGVYRYTPRAGWRHFTTDSGLSYHSVRFVFEDREGNRWIGTSGGGLHRFKQRNVASFGPAEGLPEPVVKSVTTDARGRIIVGTWGKGVARLEGTRIAPLRTPGRPPGVAPFVLSTLVDRRGRLWIGSLGSGLFVIDAQKSQRFFVGPLSGQVYSLFEDSHGAIWIGLDDADALTEEGATVFRDGEFRTYPLEGSSRFNNVSCFAEDRSDGTLWAGTTARGLYRLEGERFVPAREAPGLANERVSCLLADEDGTLWIGTEDGGVACLRRGRVTRISEAQGLAARSIGSILDDGLGNLWFGSNRGILRVPRAELERVIGGASGVLQAQVFNRSDGLVSAECAVVHQPTAVKARDGRLWFATLKGVVAVDPKRLRLNSVRPPLLIEEVLIDGRPATAPPPLMASAPALPASVIVPPGARRLEIHYTVLSFAAAEKVRFQYTLEGLDREWIDVGSRRVAYLQDLTPGRYRFRVRAANNDGFWSEGGAGLVLVVEPFVWQRPWFRLLALAVLVAAVGLTAVRVTRRTLARRIEKLEQQRALEWERARLASVLEATSDFVGFADREGHVLYVNPAGRRMVGLSEQEDVHGRTIAEFHPAWATERIVDEGIPGAIRDGIWSSETALVGAGGGEIPLSQVIVAHRASDGNVDFVSTIARDISEHKRAEQALREAEEKYRKIFENAVEGIFQGTAAGRFLAANPAMARILGYASPEELLTATRGDRSSHYIEPERRAELMRILDERGSVHDFTTHVQRADGSPIWVSLNARAVRDASGAILYYEGTAVDITQRKRVEEAESELRSALEKAALEWERTFDSMEALILIVDAAGRIARLNRVARQIAGQATTADVLGRAVADAGPGEPWRTAAQLAARVVKTHAPTHLQVCDDASGKTWELTAGPTAGAASDDERVIVVARDVTLMVELQDSLRRSETMSALGLLVSGVAHEVRNPLFGISANLDALAAKLGPTTRLDRLVGLIRVEVNRLTGLMQELLDYGRPVQSTPAPGRIDSVVAEAVDSCATLGATCAVKVVNGVPPGVPLVSMDRKRLVQVFQNLLQNAIQHSPAGCPVSIDSTLEETDGAAWVVLTVNDSGPGFEPADLPRIFEPFFTRRRGGTGLGLAIVRRIVEEHGGRVSAANRPRGGASISVRLKCAGARGQEAPSGRVAS